MLQPDTYNEKAVLCFVRTESHILLIEKLRGLGKGKINGPGGKLEPGESYLDAAIRETMEEVSVTPLNPVLYGRLGFHFSDGYSLYGEVFVATQWTGEASNSPEAIPFWCPIAEIPYEKMWADDILWLPQVLDGKFIEGIFDFDGDTMLTNKVVVSEMPAIGNR